MLRGSLWVLLLPTALFAVDMLLAGAVKGNAPSVGKDRRNGFFGSSSYRTMAVSAANPLCSLPELMTFAFRSEGKWGWNSSLTRPVHLL